MSKKQKQSRPGYMVVNIHREGSSDIHSVSYGKHESIERFVGDGNIPWRTLYRKYGWRCVKVNITWEV